MRNEVLRGWSTDQFYDRVAWLYGGCSPVDLRRGAEQVRQTRVEGGTSGR